MEAIAIPILANMDVGAQGFGPSRLKGETGSTRSAGICTLRANLLVAPQRAGTLLERGDTSRFGLEAAQVVNRAQQFGALAGLERRLTGEAPEPRSVGEL